MPSPTPATGVLRLTRAGALTLAAVSLSLAAHVLAGGAVPGLVGLLLVAAPVLALGLLATGRRLGVAAVGALLAVTQVGLHLGFMALGPGGGDGPGMTPVATGPHGHLLLGALGALGPGAALHPRGVGTSLLDLALSGTSPGMTAAHVVAGGLLGLLLARGEAALWSLLSWLRPAVPVTGRLVVLGEGPRASGTTTLRSVDRGTRVRPRGPPRRLVPAAPAADWPLAAPA